MRRRIYTFSLLPSAVQDVRDLAEARGLSTSRTVERLLKQAVAEPNLANRVLGQAQPSRPVK